MALTDAEFEKLKEGYHVWITLPIQWGDQDAFGHVNNTVYIRWFESARIEYGDRAALSQNGAGNSVGPILAAISCNYRRQLTYPDTVHIGARITKIGNSSLKMEHRIISQLLGAVAADGDSTLVAFDYAAQKPVPVPEAVRTAIEKIEGKTFAAQR
jgi:acyl-CoA thioester hydrolase